MSSPEFPDHWNRHSLAPNDSISVVVTPDTPAQATVFSQVAQMLRGGTSPLWSTGSDVTVSSDARTDRTMSAPTPQYPEQNEAPDSGPDSGWTDLKPGAVHRMPGEMDTTEYTPGRPQQDSPVSITDADNQDGWETTCGETETEAESDEETETEGEAGGSVYDRGDDTELDGCVSCSDVPESPHPTTVTDQTDDWTSASETEASPEQDEYDPYNVYHYSIHRTESPTTPRQPIELSTKLPPTPPPKDAPPLPIKDLHTPMSAHPTSPNADFTRPYLPDLSIDSSTLGLAIQTLPSHFDFRGSNGQRPSSLYTEEFYSSEKTYPDRKISYDSSRTSMDQHSEYRPSLDQQRSYPDGHSPPSSFYSGSRPASTFTQTGPPPTTAATSMTTISRAVSEEEKRLKQRYYALKEFLDTESAYFRDITIIEEIYKGSASACSAITPEDIKVIFGNSQELVEFTRSFLEMIRVAVAPVYTIARSGSGLNSAAGSIKDVDILNGTFPEVVLTYEENDQNDRKTYIGETVTKILYALEKIYTEWVLHQPPAQARLKALESNQAVSIWLAVG